MPEVSVVVPVYNVEDYLAKCIESILNQTFKDFELILVNDGSTDHSLDVIRKYEQLDERIKVVNKPNGGLSDARNAGMAIARGVYIDFVDSDDSIEPDLLKECMEKFHETDADMVIFDVYQYYQKTNTRE
ncbi:MAG: glycosyltransferase, partial [Solobacterium sp.]|nr:glycosyltransferase [Solobacterium sp.]